MIILNNYSIIENSNDGNVVSFFAPLWESGLVGGYIKKENKENEQDDKYYISQETLDKESKKFENIRIVALDNYGHPQTEDEAQKTTIGYITEVFKNTNGYITETKKEFIKPNNLWMIKFSVDKSQIKNIDFSKINGISNAYDIISQKEGGIYNGIEYKNEITEIRPDHVALVNDPRYNQCTNLIKNQFMKNESEKKIEDKEEKKENSESLESKIDSIISRLEKLESMEKEEQKDNKKNSEKEEEKKENSESEEKEEEKKNKKNSEDDMDKEYKVNGESVSLKTLIDCYSKNSKKNSESEEEKKENSEDDKEEKKEKENKKMNALSFNHSTSSKSASKIIAKNEGSKILNQSKSFSSLTDIVNFFKK